MRLRWGILLCFAIPLLEKGATVDGAHLLEALTFQIETGSSDSETTQIVERAGLTEQIGDEEIRWAQREGAGQETVAALFALQRRCKSLPAPRVPLVSRLPRPSQQQVNELYLRAAQYVHSYLANLIDFTCQSRTEVFLKQPNKDETGEWKHRATIPEQVRYIRGREQILDGKGKETWQGNQQAAGGAWSTGEFANTMRITFAGSSHPRFAWDHWEIWNGTRTAVFEYSVPAAHSKFGIETQVLRNGDWTKQSLCPAYRGYVYVNADSGAVLRLIANTSGIPSEYAINEGHSILDYSDVDISGKHFLLMKSSTTYVSTKQYRSLFEKSFRNYHRFETESKMIFNK